MANAFNNTTFSNFLTLQRGFDLPKQDRQPGVFPVVASTSIQAYHSEYKVKPPGVVTGRSGSLGSVQYIEVPFWPLNTTLWVKDFKGNEPKFVFYLLQTLGLEQYNSGAGVPTLNRNHLDGLDVAIPPLPMQRKIAAILSAYDDLIENNLRRIKILEEMAQNLYREWFVKFRFPGHQHTRFTDSPLGQIPEGWEVVKFGNLIEIRKGKNITKNTIKQGSVPVVAGGMSPAYYHSASNTRQPVITISASGANAGFVCLYHENVWASDCSVIDMNTTPYVYFFYLQLKHRQTEVTRLQRGAAQPHVNPKDLMNLDAIEIPSDFLVRFNQEVTPVIQMIRNLTLKNTNLRRTRDLLLPRLISGEVDVSELDITILEEAMT